MESSSDSGSSVDVVLVPALQLCSCEYDRLEHAVWVPEEEWPRCYNCLKRLNVVALSPQDRLVALALLLLWDRQRYQKGL